jgi:hypothetical protein
VKLPPRISHPGLTLSAPSRPPPRQAGYGVSSMLYDVLFGTLSPTLKKLS